MEAKGGTTYSRTPSTRVRKSRELQDRRFVGRYVLSAIEKNLIRRRGPRRFVSVGARRPTTLHIYLRTRAFCRVPSTLLARLGYNGRFLKVNGLIRVGSHSTFFFVSRHFPRRRTGTRRDLLVEGPDGPEVGGVPGRNPVRNVEVFVRKRRTPLPQKTCRPRGVSLRILRP